MFYEDQLVRAIRRKIAPDVMTALRDADSMEFYYPMNSVNVPLQADVKVAYDKKMAAFCVTATICDKEKDKWLGGKQYFSTIDIAKASDKAALIEYLFDESKKQLLNALAQGEFEKMLKHE